MLPPQQVLRKSLLVYGFFKCSGSFAISTAIRRASSRISNLRQTAAPARPRNNVRERLSVAVAHDKTGGVVTERTKVTGKGVRSTALSVLLFEEFFIELF
jgi:hypothetical protein